MGYAYRLCLHRLILSNAHIVAITLAFCVVTRFFGGTRLFLLGEVNMNLSFNVEHCTRHVQGST